MKYLKDVGIDVKLNTKEYGAYISTTFYGKFDSMAFGPQTGFLEPDNHLYGQYYPGELKNQSHFNDPVVADMLIRQRRTADLAKRKELIFEIQRYLAKQQYYVQMPSARARRASGTARSRTTRRTSATTTGGVSSPPGSTVSAGRG